jgi:cell fate (sporulation/competence/biofilm development) regulator YmcA (YheA/YmcA/DUF963 family)
MVNSFMTKLEQLVVQIESMDEIAITKSLKQSIECSPELLERYQTMLAMQKRLVRETVDGNQSLANQTKIAIDFIKHQLEDNPIVNEYMNGLASIQETIDLVVDVLNQEISHQ